MSGELPPDPDKITKSFPALKVRQPIGDIYIAAVDFELIQKITFFDVRRVLRDERDIERYLGIQRPLSERRVRELNEYVGYIDATFPTSIILAIESDYVDYDPEVRVLTISNTRYGEEVPDTALANLCRVIDGQHRIAGLETFKSGREKNFDVIVSIFVGSDIADQAYIFATVNLEQTKVNKSLAYDLFELARSRSPIKTCHNVAVALDSREGSPFFRRIKRLGTSTEGRDSETITQATFVNSLVRYISDNPKRDRDEILRGVELTLVSGVESKRLCFRNIFIRGDDVLIGKILENYFSAIDARWKRAWNFRGTGLMLNKTNGFRALMGIFGKIYDYLGQPGDLIPSEAFGEMFSRVGADDNFFEVDRFKPGSSGEAALRRYLDSEIFGT